MSWKTLELDVQKRHRAIIIIIIIIIVEKRERKYMGELLRVRH